MDGVDNGDVPGDADAPDGSWTVARLNREIEEVLSDAQVRFPTHVVGEVAEVEEYKFGTFFELRDLDDDPVISCLSWSSTTDSVEYDLEDGTRVVVESTVDFYPERGNCELQVSDFWPLGESRRQQELEALRRQLEEEGLFDEERKDDIPLQPACLGLVTSPAGSAREDAWAAISERSPRTDVKLCGATVQGENAVPSLVTSIERLDTDQDVETIIVTRGGGSDVDLWCFNAEPLVRCIASCTTPIIVAIGHEDDETLVEDVADARAMTPTEAGVVATTSVEETRNRLDTLERRIKTNYERVVQNRIDRLERQITTAYENLERKASRRESLRRRASDLEHRITVAYETLRESRLQTLDNRIDSGLKDVEMAAESEAASEQIARQRVANLERRIDAAYRTRVTRELDNLDRRLDTAYTELEAEQRVAASTTTVRRLWIVVAILLVILVLGSIAVSLLVL